MNVKVRLCVEHPPGAGQSVPSSRAPAHYLLMFRDEAPAGHSSTLAGVLAMRDEDAREGGSSSPWAILIGPEGGFSADERVRLRGQMTPGDWR